MFQQIYNFATENNGKSFYFSVFERDDEVILSYQKSVPKRNPREDFSKGNFTAESDVPELKIGKTDDEILKSFSILKENNITCLPGSNPSIAEQIGWAKVC